VRQWIGPKFPAARRTFRRRAGNLGSGAAFSRTFHAQPAASRKFEKCPRPAVRVSEKVDTSGDTLAGALDFPGELRAENQRAGRRGRAAKNREACARPYIVSAAKNQRPRANVFTLEIRARGQKKSAAFRWACRSWHDPCLWLGRAGALPGTPAAKEARALPARRPGRRPAQHGRDA